MCQSQYLWDSLNVICILELKLIKQLSLGLCRRQKYQHEAIGAFAQNYNISLDKASHLVKLDISQMGVNLFLIWRGTENPMAKPDVNRTRMYNTSIMRNS